MARTIYVEFAVQIPDDAETFDAIAGAEVAISGESILSYELCHVCDED